jgi:hypothetical protein
MDDEVVRDQLFHNFHLVNPLEFAKLLHSLSAVPNAVKGQLLRAKVEQPAGYKGVNLAPLMENAMAQLWKRLGVEN